MSFPIIFFWFFASTIFLKIILESKKSLKRRPARDTGRIQDVAVSPVSDGLAVAVGRDRLRDDDDKQRLSD